MRRYSLLLLIALLLSGSCIVAGCEEEDAAFLTGVLVGVIIDDCDGDCDYGDDCHCVWDDDDPPPTPDAHLVVNGKLTKVPRGGAKFGSVAQFTSRTRKANIGNSLDGDGYTFQLAQASSIFVSARKVATVNTHIELYDYLGNFIADDDDSGNGTDSVLVEWLNPGSYTIVVWPALAGPWQGDYFVTLTVGSMGGVHMGDLNPGNIVTSMVGSLAAGSDVDTYFFRVEAETRVSVSTAQLVGGLADLGIEIADYAGTPLAFDDPSGIADALVAGLLLAPGTYMVVVSNAAGGGAGDYDLTIADVP